MFSFVIFWIGVKKALNKFTWLLTCRMFRERCWIGRSLWRLGGGWVAAICWRIVWFCAESFSGVENPPGVSSGIVSHTSEEIGEWRPIHLGDWRPGISWCRRVLGEIVSPMPLISGDKSHTSTPSSRSSMVANSNCCSKDGSFIFLPPVMTDPVTCSPIFEGKTWNYNIL